MTGSNRRHGRGNRPPETAGEPQTVSIIPDHHESWLSVALNGPFYRPAPMPTTHPHPDPSTERKATSLPLKALYRVSEAMVLLSMSRTVIYEQIRAGRLRTVRQGRARRIPATAIAEYVALLEAETTGRAA